MFRRANEGSAASRARWLGDLADALDDARRLVNELGASQIEGGELAARIEAARLEVHAMRLRRPVEYRANFCPEWIEDIPWKRSA